MWHTPYLTINNTSVNSESRFLVQLDIGALVSEHGI